MLKIGLTGGIGSGKSTIASIFSSLGIPVYFADQEARKFLHDKQFIQDMITRWGDKVVAKGQVDRAYIASIVFHNEAELEWMNQQMHPRIRKDFILWSEKQTAPYVIQEAAILFESGFDDLFDHIITVSATQEERLQRVLKRDHTNEKDVRARMEKQLTEKERCQRADYIIHNNESDRVLPQILKLHNAFMEIGQSPVLNPPSCDA